MNSFFQLQNPLWRHIQRYATTAVLFPASTKPEQTTTAVVPNQPIVQATLPERDDVEPMPVVVAAPTITPSSLPLVPPSPPTIPTPATATPSPPAPVRAKPGGQAKDDDASWSHLQSIVAHHRAKRAAEEAATSSTTTAPADLAQPAPTQKPPDVPSPSVPRDERTAAAPQIQRASSPYAQPASDIAAEAKVTDLARPTIPVPSPPGTDIPHEQGQPDSPLSELTAPRSAPLEAVWPVQRVKSETADVPNSPANEIFGPPLTVADEQALRITLNKVEPSQPTDSAVDFNPPRRPRPTAVLPQAVQRQPSQSVPQPEMVPTEIGPLPADLWQLLDQKPPVSSAPLASNEIGETAVSPPAVLDVTPASPLDFEEPPSQPKPGQPQQTPMIGEVDAPSGAPQPEIHSRQPQNVAQRWPDDSLAWPDPNLPDVSQPFASLPEIPAVSPAALAPAMPGAVPEMIANAERPSFSPPDITQPMQQPLPSELSSGLSTPAIPALPTMPDAAQPMPPIRQLVPPDLAGNLPTPSLPTLPTMPTALPSMQQMQQLVQSQVPSNLPTLSAPTLPTMPDLPSLGNGTAVADIPPNPLSDLPPPETLLGLDDTADEANIDDIARQVYRHLKRRLDVEWERTRSRR